jgi:hypothetical protein
MSNFSESVERRRGAGLGMPNVSALMQMLARDRIFAHPEVRCPRR